VPEVVVNLAVEHLGGAPPPVLVATQPTPRSAYFARRYGSSLTYAVLTAVIVVPLLWAVWQSNGADAPHEPRWDGDLDAPTELAIAPAPSAERAPAPAVVAPSADAIAAGPPPEAAPGSAAAAPLQPVMASMAPRTEPAPARGQRVVLRLAQSSWIEFTGADGDRIEYALLPAGTVREYQVVGSADLRIGNTRGARLEIDGQPVDLAPHTRANVARISVGRPVEGGGG
jgi:cytoskeleton protein RodZ